MNLSPLMLSIAAPAAVNAVQSVATLASGLGRSFAQALNGAPAPAFDEVPSETFAERMSAVANRVRDWLNENGVSNPFEINLRSVGGNEQIDYSGTDAGRIEALLEQQPELKRDLQRLAASFQSMASALSPSGAHLRITEQSHDAWLL